MKKHTKRLLALALVLLIALPLAVQASANTARVPFFQQRIAQQRRAQLYRFSFRTETGATITDHFLAYSISAAGSRGQALTRHSLGRRYTQLTGQFLRDTNVATTVSFYGDGRLIRTFDLPARQFVEGETQTGVNFSVNVTGVRNLEIRVQAPQGPASGRVRATVMLGVASLGTAPYNGRIEGPELTTAENFWHNVQMNWPWIAAGAVLLAIPVILLIGLATS